MPERKFNWKRFVSLNLALFFLVVLISGVVLYLRPEGSLASWNNWSFLGLAKGRWEALHIFATFAFLLFGLWHALLQLPAIISYLGRSGNGKLGAELPALILVAALFFAVFAFDLAPLQRLRDWRKGFKQGRYLGLRQMPLACASDLSVRELCLVLGADPAAVGRAAAAARLRAFDCGRSLVDIAGANSMRPYDLFEMLFGP